MNIIVATSPDEQIENVLSGWSFALRAIGCNVIRWGGVTPLFGIFEKYKPDFFLLGASSINKVAQKVVEEFKTETLVLFCHQDEFKLHIDGSKEIYVLPSKEELLDNQYRVEFGWDAINYSPSKKDNRYISKYAYLGRYNPRYTEILLNLGNDVRIYSPDVHNSLSYVGNDSNKPAIYASAESIVMYDWNTDCLNVIYSGGKITWDIENRVVDKRDSYFHRIYDFVKNVYPENKSMLEQLLEKAKEVEQ